jgi:hypothetical protein
VLDCEPQLNSSFSPFGSHGVITQHKARKFHAGFFRTSVQVHSIRPVSETTGSVATVSV